VFVLNITSDSVRGIGVRMSVLDVVWSSRVRQIGPWSAVGRKKNICEMTWVVVYPPMLTASSLYLLHLAIALLRGLSAHMMLMVVGRVI
jgi:hypothetical protein